MTAGKTGMHIGLLSSRFVFPVMRLFSINTLLCEGWLVTAQPCHSPWRQQDNNCCVKLRLAKVITVTWRRHLPPNSQSGKRAMKVPAWRNVTAPGLKYEWGGRVLSRSPQRGQRCCYSRTVTAPPSSSPQCLSLD